MPVSRLRAIMTIEMKCTGCQWPFKWPDSMAGKTDECPVCGVYVTIPPTGSQPASAPSIPSATSAATSDESGNLRRWQETKEPYRWVWERSGSWDHALWVALLESL